MTNPALVEVLRGGAVESRHAGAIAVVDADGGLVWSVGDIDQPVFPRSAIKGLQALPLIESGAADRFGLTASEIALSCASHNGEAEHAETAASMLSRCGCKVGHLACGAHWPMRAETAQDLARLGAEPTALHNNCSGKHAGFLCVATAMGVSPEGYERPDHAVMREVIAAVESMTGSNARHAPMGIDGCSIPTIAMPLRALARGFARFGTGHGLEPRRAEASRRIRQAVAESPFHVAGTDRFDTRLMSLLRERVFVKVGAEGVFCAALPEIGLGVALKCDDGATRAAEVMVAAVIKRFLPLDGLETAAFDAFCQPVIKNWKGLEVGSLRSISPLV